MVTAKKNFFKIFLLIFFSEIKLIFKLISTSIKLKISFKDDSSVLPKRNLKRNLKRSDFEDILSSKIYSNLSPKHLFETSSPHRPTLTTNGKTIRPSKLLISSNISQCFYMRFKPTSNQLRALHKWKTRNGHFSCSILNALTRLANRACSPHSWHVLESK